MWYDNFGGGYLEIKVMGGQTLQVVTPPTHTGGEDIYQRGVISSLIYELHRYVTPPVWLLCRSVLMDPQFLP